MPTAPPLAPRTVQAGAKAALRTVTGGTLAALMVTAEALTPGSATAQTRLFAVYVSDRGSDDNTGLTSLHPKATPAAAMALINGTTRRTLWVQGGSEFRAQFTYPATSVSIRTYGAGGKPVIKAIDVAENANFSATGTTNVYQISWTHNVTPAATTFLSLWIDGVKMVRVESEAACSALAGSYYLPTGNVTASTSTVMVHPTGSTDPRTDGKTYEITARDYCVFSSRNDSTLEGVVGIGCGHNDGVLVFQGERMAMSNCEAYDGKKHNIFIRDGLGEDLTAVGIEDNSTVYVAYANDPTTYNTIWRRCAADGALPGGAIPVEGVTGFYAHSADLGVLYESITLEDCEAVRCSVGHSQDAALVTSTRFKSSDCFVHIRTGVSGGAGRAIVIEPFLDGRGSTADWDSDRVIEFNLATASLSGGVVLGQAREDNKILVYCGEDCDLDLLNVSLIGSRASFGIYRNGGGTLTTDRVIFDGISTPYNSGFGGLAGMVATNNVYHRSAGAITWNDGVGAYTTFAAWQAAGHDLDGVNTDPLFANDNDTWTEPADAVVTAPSVVNLMAGATYYNVPRIAPQITSLSISQWPLAGLAQAVSYTATGTPGIVPTYAWRLNGALVSTAAVYAAAAGSLTLTLTLTNEGGAVSSTTAPFVVAASVTTLDVDFIADTAEQESIAYADVADWLTTKATFTRATTGTYLDAAGAMTTFAIDAMRYGDAGLLYEPSRTNSLLRSAEFDNAYWQDISTGTTTRTADQAVAPDGTTSVDKLVGNNNNTILGRTLSTGWASKSVAWSVWLKATAGYTGALNLGFAGGATYNQSALITTALQRFSNVKTFVAGDTGTVRPAISHGNAHETFAWGTQFEEIPSGELQQATSYIPTTTLAVTRAADALTLNLPAGEHYVLLTFDNDDQQVIEDVADNYTLTNTLDRFSIQRLQVLSAA